MIHVILCLAVGGCQQNVVVQKQQAVVQQVVAQQVQYSPAVYVAPLVQTYGVIDPYLAFRQPNQELQELREARALIEEQRLLLEQYQASSPQTQPNHDCKECRPSVAADGPNVTLTARAILDRSCVKCHNAEKMDGGLDLTNPMSFATKLEKIRTQVDEGRMPKGGPELNNQEAGIIAAWTYALEAEAANAVTQYLKSK